MAEGGREMRLSQTKCLASFFWTPLSLNELTEASEWSDRQDLLNDFRGELFAIRDGINDLRKQLRSN